MRRTMCCGLERRLHPKMGGRLGPTRFQVDERGLKGEMAMATMHGRYSTVGGI